MRLGLHLGLGPRTGGTPAPSYDADAQTYFTAMTVQPTTAQKDAINTFILAGKSAGWWDKLTYLSLLAGHTQQAALLNLKNPAQTSTATGAPTFDTLLGYTQATAKYVSSALACNVLFSQDDALVGIHTDTEGQNAQATLANAANTGVRLTLRNASNQIGARLNSSASVLASTTSAVAAGLTVIQRPSSAVLQFYRNGAKLGTDVANTSTAVNTDALRFFHDITASDTRRLRAVMAGASMTDAQNTALSTDLASYFTAISPVLTAASSVAVPDIAGFSAAGKGFTNTGLHSLGGGNFLMGDDGRYGVQTDVFDATNWRPKIHVVSSAGALVSTIDIYALDSSPTSVQGVTVDGNGDYWVARLTRNVLMKISPAGALLATYAFANDGGPNGLAYDPVRDIMYCAGINSTQRVYRISTSGVELSSFNLTDDSSTAQTIDQLCVSGDNIYATKGANGSNGTVQVVNLTSLTTSKIYALPEANCIEGVAIVGSDMYINNDSYFHVQSPNINALQKYTLP